MPAKIKIQWSDLLAAARRLWSELGRAPTPNAVNEAAGGGATNRIVHVITAVGIEHGQHVTLYASLPDDLRALIKDPKDRPDPLPEVNCSPALAAVVRDAMAQTAAACEAAEREARIEAERLVAEGEVRMAVELGAMYQRLQASAADVEAEAHAHASAVADYERRLGETTTALASAREEIAGRTRELEHAAGECENARAGEQEARAHRERTLEQNQTQSAAYAVSLAAVTERALRAEAERDAVGQVRERLREELEKHRVATDVAAERSDKEITGLRAELAAAQQALHAAEQKRVVAEALLAEARAGRAPRTDRVRRAKAR